MENARAELSGILHLVGVAPGIDALLRRELEPGLAVEAMADQARLYHRFQEGRRPADTVLLGMDIEEPVRIAQRIHTYDKHVPILILSPPARCAQLKRTLMFSPFLGNQVAPWSTAEVDELPAAIRDAVNRRQQRLRYLNTISSAQIRLETLPLLQPEATHYLDQLLDHAPIGVLTVDLGGAILTLNRQAMTTLGISERAALGRPLEEQFPGRERERLKALLERSLNEMSRLGPEIFEIDAPERGIRFLEITLAPLAYRTGQRGAMLILQDVTDRVAAERERQRAEDDLRFHATVLRTFHEISSDLELSLEEKLRRLLKLGCEQFGLPIAILSRIDGQCFCIQDSVSDNPAFAAGTTRELDQTYCSAAVFTNEPVAFEHAAISEWREHPSYRENHVESYIGARVMVDGGLYGTLCFASLSPRLSPFSSTDRETLKLMSQWVGSELQRERAEAHMRKLSGALEQTADSVIITDRERRIEYVNPAFELLTGYCKADVLGHKTYFLRSGVHDDAFYQDLWQVIGNGCVYRGFMVNRKKDGSIFHEQKTITPLKDAQGQITHFISTGHDITDLVRAEELDRQHKMELAHVARLSILGEMTSGLAHELNQPLCAITTYAQTCLRIIQAGDSRPEEVRYGLEQVVRQAELGSAIFRRLRNFARKGDLRQQRVDLCDVINEVAGFVRAEAQQNQVQLRLEIPHQLPAVMADPIQIEQVLLNLVRNSMDALASVDEEQRLIRIKAARHQRHSVRICIGDSGRGCPPDVADRLFEPFFTTKSDGLGIGLGISQSIIDAHGGRLWLEANSTQGAMFCFILPGAGGNQHEKRPVQ
jgi:PAS domain S-box-containing protein